MIEITHYPQSNSNSLLFEQIAIDPKEVAYLTWSLPLGKQVGV